MEVGHGCRLDVLLPEHLHLHRCVGELVGEVVQEVWEVGSRSVDDSHHKRRSLGLVFAEREGHKLLGKALHVSRRQAGELLTVGVHHRRSSVGLLLNVDQAAKLQTGQTWRLTAVMQGVVAQPVPGHGGDGGGGSSGDGSILMVLLLWSSGSVEQAAAIDAVVAVHSAEELGKTQRHP